MTLLLDFHFSQGSLQDYVECQRRFQLRYLVKLVWPAVEAEPVLENERKIQMGGQFHRLVQQHLVGLDTEHLSRIAQGMGLQIWWQNYLQFAEGAQARPGLVAPETDRYVETSLSVSIDKFRLIAKYDAVILVGTGHSAKVTIYDWKTSNKRPTRGWLAKRLQTRIYPYLIMKSGVFNSHGIQLQAEQIEMIYWFVNFPDDPERFQYSVSQYEQDDNYLVSLIDEIDSLSPDAFDQTSHEKNCRFCTYRSLCDRGVKAGSIDQVEFDGFDDQEPQAAAPILDFEQVVEIEY